MIDPKPILTVRSATDILDVVPTLLGFIPTESLIILYFDTVDGHERLAVTARMDLPVDADQHTAALARAEHHATRHKTLILVAYSADTAAAENALLHLLDTCLKVKVAISATTQGWAEIAIGEQTHRHPYPDTTSAVTAGIVGAGYQQPHQTRDDLIDTIGPTTSETEKFAALVDASDPLTGNQLTSWLLQRTRFGYRTVDRVEAAVLVASVQEIDVRDAAWAVITCADADLHIDLWRQIARYVDGRLALPVLGLLGMAAWIGGQGALANIVLDRAAQTDGYVAYTLFELLHAVLQRGDDPRVWDRMRDLMLAETDVSSLRALRLG